jgi:hypothetical protein
MGEIARIHNIVLSLNTETERETDMLDNFDSVNSGNIGSEELPNLNLGNYTALRVEKLRIFAGTKPGKTNIQYFKAVFTVLKAENGHAAGDVAQMFESISGGAYPHFDQQAQSRVKKLLGAIAGLKTDAEITTKVTSKDLMLATSEANPFKGAIVAAVVSGKDPRFPKVVCTAVDGAVPAVPSTVDHTARPSAPVPPTAPVVNENKYTVANGWYPFDAMPGHVYNAGGQVIELATGKQVR